MIFRKVLVLTVGIVRIVAGVGIEFIRINPGIQVGQQAQLGMVEQQAIRLLAGRLIQLLLLNAKRT